MKLLHVNQARVIWLFQLNELNPRGRASANTAPIEIGKRYSFAISPNPVDIIVAREKNEPLKFLQGAFSPKGKDAVQIDLLIYRDGMVADTRSTTLDSDAFLEDLLTWGTETLGLLSHTTIPVTKLLVSELVVSTEKSLSVLNPKLTNFAKRIAGKAPQLKHPFEVGAVSFWTDQAVLPHTPSPFRFERLQGAPFDQNKYYSSAPMGTEAHLDLLEELESLLG